jgi:hypothetical protein
VNRAFAALSFLFVLAGCLVDRRSVDFECEDVSDCGTGRECSSGFCVSTGSTTGGLICEGSTCTAVCSNMAPCGVVTCPAGATCVITCTTPNACATIDCSTAVSCDIHCEASNSCQAVVCGSANCDVECIGLNACGLCDICP